MNNDTWIGKKGFRYWYYRFRDSQYYGVAIICFVLCACLVLFFTIIIPEITQWFSIRNEVIATREHIDTLQKNINFINNLDKNILDLQLQTVSHALPPQMNFGYMLNALSNAAANSGVSLSDYSFQVGNITSDNSGKTSTEHNGFFATQLTIAANGNLSEINQFIKSLENNLPISEVVSINGTGNSVSIELQFYQKPFSNVTFSADTPLENLSVKKINLIENLTKQDNTNANQDFSGQSSSNSAIPLF